MLRLMLEKEGYDVVEAESGEECLEKFDHLKGTISKFSDF
jgi:CheY-like chemotaxis protein